MRKCFERRGPLGAGFRMDERFPRIFWLPDQVGGTGRMVVAAVQARRWGSVGTIAGDGLSCRLDASPVCCAAVRQQLEDKELGLPSRGRMGLVWAFSLASGVSERAMTPNRRASSGQTLDRS